VSWITAPADTREGIQVTVTPFCSDAVIDTVAPACAPAVPKCVRNQAKSIDTKLVHVGVTTQLPSWAADHSSSADKIGAEINGMSRIAPISNERLLSPAEKVAPAPPIKVRLWRFGRV
jgi:hypothetical protein